MNKLPSIAARNVTRNRRRSLITIFAIVIGVTAVTFLQAFADGFVQLMVEDTVKGKTGALQIHRKGYVDSIEGAPLTLHMPQGGELLEKVRTVSGVTGVTGRIQFSGLVSNGLSQTMFAGRGIDLQTESQVCPRSGFDVKPGGGRLEPGDYDQALLGSELGDSFRATTPATKQAALQARAEGADRLVDLVTLASSSPEGRANSVGVTVKGLTVSTQPFENKRVVTVPLRLAQDLLGMQGKVTELAVSVGDLGELDRIAEDLRHSLGPDYEVHTWRDLQPMLRDIIVRQTFVLGLVAVILFVIILTGIINTMLMSVFERVREIGTMMAVGVRRRQVLQLFLVEAALLGLVGGLLGGALGRTLVSAVAVKGIPIALVPGSQSILYPAVSPLFIASAVVAAALGALLAASYPAWKASRLSPVEALRST